MKNLQEGIRKFPCYARLWDSRDTKAHYQRWPKRFTKQIFTARCEPDRPHVPSGIFPKLPKTKVKARVFGGPQIKKVLECKEFPKKLTKAASNIYVFLK